MTLDNILLSFETVLKIEYDEKDTRKLINSAIRKLESAYAMRIQGTTLYDIQSTNLNMEDSINNLLSQIFECCKTLSLFTTLSMYTGGIPIRLSTVNYLGMDEVQLKAVLRYLQYYKHASLCKDALSVIASALNNVNINYVKRLFIILLVLDELGIDEGVVVVAQLLYLGGLS